MMENPRPNRDLGEWAIALHGRVLVPQGGWWFQYVNILYIGINFTTFCFLGGAFNVSIENYPVRCSELTIINV